MQKGHHGKGNPKVGKGATSQKTTKATTTTTKIQPWRQERALRLLIVAIAGSVAMVRPVVGSAPSTSEASGQRKAERNHYDSQYVGEGCSSQNALTEPSEEKQGIKGEFDNAGFSWLCTTIDESRKARTRKQSAHRRVFADSGAAVIAIPRAFAREYAGEPSPAKRAEVRLRTTGRDRADVCVCVCVHSRARRLDVPGRQRAVLGHGTRRKPHAAAGHMLHGRHEKGERILLEKST